MAAPGGKLPVDLMSEEVDEDNMTEKQRRRRRLETNPEASKDEIKAMSPFEIFALFDDDDSGLIDFEEFKRMLPFLEIRISELKAFRYFRICDTDGSGEIDVDEFKVALFICDPTSGNPVGFTPIHTLTPMDAFETFDEDQSGFLDEDEFFYAMEYLKLNPTDHKHEQLWLQFDSNHLGSLDYYEFREVFMMMCDVDNELEERGFDVPTFTRRKTKVQILRGYLDDEERRERLAIAEAKRYKKWILAVREKKKVLQKAGFRAYQELRNALDAGGHVYVFGGGAWKQFDFAPNANMKTSKFDFQLFEKVNELWKDRVKPEQLIDKLKNQRKAEEEEEKRDLERNSGMGALDQIKNKKQVIIDPYKEALVSGFVGLNVALNTAAIWGRRIHHVAISESVLFALADTGEVYTWGGNSYWWHEIQPDSLYQSKWRGDTTARSQLLLGTVNKQLPPDANLDNVDVETMSPEDKLAENIKIVSKYYDCWEPPPNPATRMIYFKKELLPKLDYDSLVFSLKARGKEMKEKTKIELVEELYEDIIIEKRLLGERAHKAIRELETQVSDLLRRKKTKLANKFLKRIDEMWEPLREVQAEQRAAEINKRLAKEHNEALKIETDYTSYRDRLLKKRESTEPQYSARGNSLTIDLNGVTPRGKGMETPRGFQAATQLSAGSAHACLVHKSGQLYTWGTGAAGRLGHDVTEAGDPQKDVVKPTLVQALSGRPVIRVSCGYSHTGCIVAGGELYMWGSGATGKLGLGGITNTQECYCSIPTRVMVGAEDRRIRKLACGSAHTAVVTEAGLLYVFGCGDGGRLGLGLGAYDTVYEPVLVEGLEGVNIANISCGNTTTFAVSEVHYRWEGREGARYRTIEGGIVYMAGSQNVLGMQCDTFKELQLPHKVPIKLVSAGFQHTALVSAEGELLTFGFNRKICCGVTPQSHFVPRPTIVGCLYANPTNIALHARAYQSSTYDSREASYAVNGETGGNGLDRCSCTQQDSQGWIEIDLDRMACIDEIKIWNRTDVPKDRHLSKDTYTNKLFPCWILIGREPFKPGLNQVHFKDNLRDAVAKARLTENQRVSIWHPPANTQGRYIRVQIENYEQLALAEIEVMGNYGLSRGVGRVSYALAGRDVTVAVIRPTTDPRDVENAYKRAAYADAANADILRQLETYALEYDKYGRGEVLFKECSICKGATRCEACDLYETYSEEIAKIPPGVGGRRRRLRSIDEFLININKPELEIVEVPRHKRPSKAQKRNARWKAFWGSLFGSKKKGEITPEQALEIDPEDAFEKVIITEEAEAEQQGREAKMKSDELLAPEKLKKVKTKRNYDAEEEKKDDDIPENLGTSRIDEIQQTFKQSIRTMDIPKVGDKLLTGQVVRGSVPKSISGPAAEAESYVAEELEKKKNKKETEEKVRQQQALINKQGNIS